ncbi:MAG: NADH-quinone oxidoreductase subunit N [Coriobacteriia bacterium]
MNAFAPLMPEFLVLAAALAALFAERITGSDRSAAWLGSGAALVGAIGAAVMGVREGIAGGGMLAFDEVSVVTRVAILGLTAVYLLWLAGSRDTVERSREMTSLVLFAALGGMLMASARDLVTLFISIELATMPAYVLMGYRREDARTLEGALKYFLLSMTTSLFLLYGFSFLFGIAGSTAFSSLADVRDAGLLWTFAAVFAFVGLLAKMSAAPFHFWAPDAYAGAPAASVAFVSTVPKIAGTAVMVNLAAVLAPSVETVPQFLAAAALASMALGNFAAFPQTDIRRLMAYSGVAHTGYVLLALSADTTSAFAAAIVYSIAYAIPSMAVVLVAAEEGTSLDDFAGLVGRRPVLAWSLVVLLLSLVGVPPMVGMFGKLLLFTAAIDAGRTALVVFAVLMSVVSAGYYFKVLRQAFFAERPGAVEKKRSWAAVAAIGACVAATLLLGIVLSPLLGYLGLAF